MSLRNPDVAIAEIVRMTHRRIEPASESAYGPCECCGHNSRTIWGYTYFHDEPESAYYVHWTVERVGEHGAHFDLILGEWGDGTGKADRCAVSLEFRETASGRGFMVIDATERPVARSPLVGRALLRRDVVGTALAAQAFEIIDAIWIGDVRIAEITRPAT